VLAANFGVPADAFKNITLDQLWIFQGKDPGPLAADERAGEVSQRRTDPSVHLLAERSGADPADQGGFVQIRDSRNFNVSKTVAAALVRSSRRHA